MALLARSVTANPINFLFPLLQEDTARTFTCPFVQAQFAFSHINFVARANSIDGLPAALLDCFVVLKTEPLQGEVFSFFIAKIMGNIVDRSVRSEIVSLVEYADLFLRDLGRFPDRFDFIFCSPTL